jgi:hypothetical protein
MKTRCKRGGWQYTLALLFAVLATYFGSAQAVASAFDVRTFRPWAGYAMPNGIWLTGDFDGDGRQDLVHAVQSTDYAHTWLSNGNGTFRVGTFRPWLEHVGNSSLLTAGCSRTDCHAQSHS